MYYRDWPAPYHSYCFLSESIRELHGTCTAITVPRELYGEKIHPGSIELTDDSADSTFTIVDDRNGNLYDSNYSSSLLPCHTVTERHIHQEVDLCPLNLPPNPDSLL